MNSGLASNADQPYGQAKGVVVVEYENPVVNWLKLLGLILFTFSLIVSMWEIWYLFSYAALLWSTCTATVCQNPIRMLEDCSSVSSAAMCWLSAWRGSSGTRREMR